MSTKSFLQAKDIEPENPLLSGIRTIIETAFYGNNVE
ncbi:PTS beta-glucoside transporter subunit IIA, partial [Bacteroides fragilis]